MQPAPVPADETQRLDALRRYEVDALVEHPGLGAVTRLLSMLLGIPTTLLTFVEERELLTRMTHGAAALMGDGGDLPPSLPRDIAFCSHTILSSDVLVIEDASHDLRFADSPVVRGHPGIRFYAGAPLITPSGHRIGSLCAMDKQPRQLSDQQLTVLRHLADLARDQLELRCLAKRLQQELEARQRAELRKDELVALVTHELRTPLTSIRGSLDLVASGITGELGPRTTSFVATARTSAERLSRLIDDVLDIETLEKGELPISLQPIELGFVIRRALEATEGLARKRGVTVAIGEVSLLYILADTDRMVQVLVNLLANAIKFSPEGSLVEVLAASEERHARITVQDQGPGIPDEFRPRIFGRFQRAARCRTQPISGTGLGLSIAQAIVTSHNGQIGFESPIGKEGGTAFWFTVPLTHSPESLRRETK